MRRLRRIGTAAIVALPLVTGVAGAQTRTPPPAPQESRGYAEGFAQSAFSNVTSQSYGGEIGVTVYGTLQVYVEAGQVRDVASDAVSANAQAIAQALTGLGLQPTYSVKQPVTFYGGGVRYPITIEDTKLRPYVLGGFGAAKVKNDVNFTLGAGGSLSQYVTLGSDLTGSQTKGMLELGAGVQYPVWQQLIIDLQFRYGRIFTEGQATNVTRAGLGIGVAF